MKYKMILKIASTASTASPWRFIYFQYNYIVSTLSHIGWMLVRSMTTIFRWRWRRCQWQSIDSLSAPTQNNLSLFDVHQNVEWTFPKCWTKIHHSKPCDFNFKLKYRNDNENKCEIRKKGFFFIEKLTLFAHTLRIFVVTN